MTQKFKSHPWHGIHIGDDAPATVTAFIEIVPTDTVKYEVDKASGYLKIDRPQKYSNITPSLYGFIPKTYCGDHIADFARKKSGKEISKGDGDPLDICVLTEHTITHGDVILPVIPIGGFRMIDKGEADDKIIAVMKGDQVYEQWNDISQLPEAIVKRMRHYFLTYKNIPGEEARVCEIAQVYGREEAQEVIRYAMKDYEALVK
jgi:inorganic pyrophosphatase